MQKPRYMNKTWLTEQYVTKKLSTRQMGKEEGVNAATIRNWLIRFGIPRRPATNINYVDLSNEAIEFLSGELLGDASIIWGEKPVSTYYSLTSKYETYLKYIEKKLLKFGILKRGHIKSYTNKWSTYWLLQSKYYRDELPNLRTLWYPDGKKIVPKNISLSPTTVKMWFIEDGSATHTKNVRRITLATNGFILADVSFLRDKLEAAIACDGVYVHKGNGFTIEMYRKTTIKAFYDYIGECPKEIEDIYGYKWKLR